MFWNQFEKPPSSGKTGEKQFSVELWYFAYYQKNVLALIVCFFSLFSLWKSHSPLHYHWTQIVCMYACSLTSIRKPSFDACWKIPKKFLKITISYSKTPVFEFVGRFHEDFQPCLCYATHRSLVGLSPVFGAHATRISQ